MFKIQLELTRHAKNQENLNAANTHAKVADVLELCDKFSKATIIKMFQWWLRTHLKNIWGTQEKNKRCVLSLILFNIAPEILDSSKEGKKSDVDQEGRKKIVHFLQMTMSKLPKESRKQFMN